MLNLHWRMETKSIQRLLRVLRVPPAQLRRIHGSERHYLLLVSPLRVRDHHSLDCHDSTHITDGGGIRGYSSLLLLRAVMTEIAIVERKNPQVSHSAHPLPPRSRDPVRVSRTRATGPQAATDLDSTVFGLSPSSHYFPSHYFDYIAGTSTGG